MEESRTLLAKPKGDHVNDDDKKIRFEMKASTTSMDTISWCDGACHSSSSSYLDITFDQNEKQTSSSNHLYELLKIAKEGDVGKLNELIDDVGKRGISTVVAEQNGKKTNPLHIAVQRGHIEVVDALVACGTDDLVRSVDHHRNTLLHVASSVGHLDIVKDLVCRGASMNHENRDRQTALHLACHQNRPEVARFLFENGAEITIHDSTYLTPLQVAINHDSFDALLVLLVCMVSSSKKHHDVGAEIHRWAAANNKAASLSKILDSDIRFPTLSDVDIMDFIMDAVKNRHKELVMVLLNWSHQTVVHHTDSSGNTPLHYAAEVGDTVIMLELIKARANVNAKNGREDGERTPLHLAAGNGWIRAVGILLQYHAHIDERDRCEMTPLHHACMNGQIEMVEMLLFGQDDDPIANKANAVVCDEDGRTCLDHAIDNGFEDVAKLILRHSKWRDLMCVSSLDDETNYRTTPMRKLIQSMPDVGKLVLDRCITLTGGAYSSKPSKNVTVEFYYEFLEDTFSTWIRQPDGGKHGGILNKVYQRLSTMRGSQSSKREKSQFDLKGRLKRSAWPYIPDPRERFLNHPLQIMTSLQRESLLDHPVVTTFLHHKWVSVGRYAFISSLVIYLLFLFMLTGFIVVMPPNYYVQGVNTSLEDPDHIIWRADGRKRWVDTASHLKLRFFSTFGYIVIIALSVLNLFREVVQMAVHRLNYFKSPNNYLELFLYIASILFTLPKGHVEYASYGRYIQSWKWSLGACSGFLAWINCVLFMRRSSLLGIYIIMFLDITRTFLKFGFILFMFIMAFGLTFYALLMNQNAFHSLEYSLAKTFVMMIGEFDFESIFFTTNYMESESISLMDNDAFMGTVFLSKLTYLFFILFVVLMPILMMNMLVGLAVDDIQAIQAKAHLHRLTMQVDYVMELQCKFPLWVWRSSVIRRKSFIVRKTKVGKWMQLISSLRKELKKAIKICNNKQLAEPSSDEDRIKDINMKVDEVIHEIREGHGKQLQESERTQSSQKSIQNRVGHLEDNMKLLHKKIDALLERSALPRE
ncbi:transient receptor potential cation channel subfamily A member 1 homolog isoform X2 [Lytechinus variegatus]|uniref:transient receptor potential cation channel subfamily A member 1 homolog isoform X2 n=1 Tax=Lytechinus variegatus TaxID=7654 RepID=UPI001BB2C1C0|nr:transient receptor potential cation channel subfamily A member 1 homolog isoform X2 [Lytechinus variegatus]